MEEITQITKYRVGSSEFPSLEAAQEYIKRNAFNKEVYSKNCTYLNSLNFKYCPAINSEGELCLWANRYNNTDQGDGWEELFNTTYLRYVKEEIKVISAFEFIHYFISEAENLFIEVNDFKEILAALKFNLDIAFRPSNIDEVAIAMDKLEKVLDSLGKIHFSPVYIHD